MTNLKDSTQKYKTFKEYTGQTTNPLSLDEKVCGASLAEFALSGLTAAQTNLLNDVSLAMAGGVMRCILLDEPIKDIDLFILGDMDEALNVLASLSTDLSGKCEMNEYSYSVNLTIDGVEHPAQKDVYLVKQYATEFHPEIQYIYSTVTALNNTTIKYIPYTVEDVVNAFDFTCVAAGVQISRRHFNISTRMYMLKSFFTDNVIKVLRTNYGPGGNVASFAHIEKKCSLLRYTKYIQYGYTPVELKEIQKLLKVPPVTFLDEY